MSAQIEYFLGELFELKTDLIVLPCSRNGSITSWVRSRIHEFNIPGPSGYKGLGATEFLILENNNNKIASYACWATSVAKPNSTPTAIQQIGKSIAEYAAVMPEIKLISAPLLGSGAGGLEELVSADAIANGFLNGPENNSTLRLHILNEDIYNDLKKKKDYVINRYSNNMRIFLCHSSSDKNAVRELYWKLRKDGFNPWLDEENLVPGTEWRIEIENEVRHSDVVIVCLSKSSISKTGFVQKEIAIALDAADERPEGTIYIIPARLENCEVPVRINKWHWVNLFETEGYRKLLNALRKENT